MQTVTTVIPRLTRWGLAPDADLIYRALAMCGNRTTTQLVRELGISQCRVSDALDELVAIDAVRPIAAAPANALQAKAEAWAPVTLERVLHRLRQPGKPCPPVERWRRHMATLTGLGLAGVETVSARRWPTRALSRRRAAQLIAGERHEHLTINTEEVFDPEAVAAALPNDRGMLARGIRLRVLGRPASDGDRYCAYATALGGAGGLYREMAAPPLKLMIFDRQVAFLPADPLDLDKGYVEVRDASAVQALSAVFDRLWPEATDPRREGVPPIDLTDRERVLVGLLALGHTDQTAARELGISVRTVAYTMRALMDRLGVENRFQLALVLAATGTVSPTTPYEGSRPRPESTATS